MKATTIARRWESRGKERSGHPPAISNRRNKASPVGDHTIMGRDNIVHRLDMFQVRGWGTSADGSDHAVSELCAPKKRRPAGTPLDI
ncbi:hypothetical protein OHB00_07125 [Streptomyces sp. NBC_00631]|uniref:hypothetical protein n=1 Tax=Streptomyces sp. NBC_00631 TaxID=2975793 RepID=UPI0030E548F8